ncbi:MAG: 4-hydroxy-tetrahydrodipicolinate reductase [Woeseiaceae bacterium]
MICWRNLIRLCNPAERNTVHVPAAGWTRSSASSSVLARGDRPISPRTPSPPTPSRLTLGIAGAGRMGQAIAASIDVAPEFELAGIWSRGSELEPIVSAADVMIDFSLPAGTMTVLEAVARYRTPLVCGVSGLTSVQMASLERATNDIAIVYDRNMSLGIAVLDRIVRAAAAALGREFNVEISETHHVHKKDAPSGTALKLGQAIADARGEDGTDAISFASERLDEVPGDHEVTLRSDTEILTLAHSVTTRQVFVDGALRAARWVADQPPGRYGMRDVLFGH